MRFHLLCTSRPPKADLLNSLLWNRCKGNKHSEVIAAQQPLSYHVLQIKRSHLTTRSHKQTCLFMTITFILKQMQTTRNQRYKGRMNITCKDLRQEFLDKCIRLLQFNNLLSSLAVLSKLMVKSTGLRFKKKKSLVLNIKNARQTLTSSAVNKNKSRLILTTIASMKL